MATGLTCSTQVVLDCDVLIIGSGAAGLRAAVAAAAAGADVLVADRGEPGRAGTTVAASSDWMAFGAAFGHGDPRDSPAQHALDILVKGALCVLPELARRIAEDAPARLRDLESYGAAFDKAPDGTYLQVHSDGASYPRACGRGADTGPTMVRALVAECRRTGVRLTGGLQLADLLLGRGGQAVGALFLDCSGEVVAVHAGAVVLATGGAGLVFEHNAYPPGMYGAGYAAALRAGARLANMEFIQIGPCINRPFKFALSGIFWRMDPRITSGVGEEFLARALPDGVDLAAALHVKGHSFPFTVRNDSFYVDTAIYREIIAGRVGPNGGVFIDVTGAGSKEIERRAEVPLLHLLKHGVDIRTSPIEFAPSIQHCNGGVLIDEDAQCDVPGLFAAGEVAGGQHGADRPGGNALADSQAFGAIAGASAAQWAAETGHAEPMEARGLPGPRGSGREVGLLLRELACVMWRGCSVVRDDAGLCKALADVREIGSQRAQGSRADLLDLRDALAVAETHLVSARSRTESRGTHFRADHPRTADPEWIRIRTVRLADDGSLVLDVVVPDVAEDVLNAWLTSPERRSEPLLGY